MDRTISLYVKLIGLFFLVASIFFPLFLTSGEIVWTNNNSPPGAVTKFTPDMAKAGMFYAEINEYRFDESTGKFNRLNLPEDQEEIKAMQVILRILIFLALIFVTAGTIIHYRKIQSKLASFLVILGILANLLVMLLISAMNQGYLTTLEEVGWIRDGSKVQSTYFVSGEYSYTVTAEIEYGIGYILLGASILITMISLFLKAEEEQ